MDPLRPRGSDAPPEDWEYNIPPIPATQQHNPRRAQQNERQVRQDARNPYQPGLPGLQYPGHQTASPIMGHSGQAPQQYGSRPHQAFSDTPGGMQGFGGQQPPQQPTRPLHLLAGAYRQGQGHVQARVSRGFQGPMESYGTPAGPHRQMGQQPHDHTRFVARSITDVFSSTIDVGNVMFRGKRFPPGTRMGWDSNGNPVLWNQQPPQLGQPEQYPQQGRQGQLYPLPRHPQSQQGGFPTQYQQGGFPTQYQQEGFPRQYQQIGLPPQYPQQGQPVQHLQQPGEHQYPPAQRQQQVQQSPGRQSVQQSGQTSANMTAAEHARSAQSFSDEIDAAILHSGADFDEFTRLYGSRGAGQIGAQADVLNAATSLMPIDSSLQGVAPAGQPTDHGFREPSGLFRIPGLGQIDQQQFGPSQTQQQGYRQYPLEDQASNPSDSNPDHAMESVEQVDSQGMPDLTFLGQLPGSVPSEPYVFRPRADGGDRQSGVQQPGEPEARSRSSSESLGQDQAQPSRDVGGDGTTEDEATPEQQPARQRRLNPPAAPTAADHYLVQSLDALQQLVDEGVIPQELYQRLQQQGAVANLPAALEPLSREARERFYFVITRVCLVNAVRENRAFMLSFYDTNSKAPQTIIIRYDRLLSAAPKNPGQYTAAPSGPTASENTPSGPAAPGLNATGPPTTQQRASPHPPLPREYLNSLSTGEVEGEHYANGSVQRKLKHHKTALDDYLYDTEERISGLPDLTLSARTLSARITSAVFLWMDLRAYNTKWENAENNAWADMEDYC